MTIQTVLFKKDCPNCQVLYIYINTWQAGQSFFKRTVGERRLILFLRKGFSIGRGLGALKVKTSVLFKKDCPDCQVLYIYINTWQSGQSFLERTVGERLLILFLRKRFSIGRGLGALKVKTLVLFKKDCPNCQVLYIYILTPDNQGSPFWKGLYVWSWGISPFLKGLFVWLQGISPF